MTVAAPLGPVSAYVRDRVAALLDERRVVVWYDAVGAFRAFAPALALPDHAAEISRLFRDGRPTLDLLDGLRAGARYPLVRQALQAESPAEALVAAFSRPDALALLDAVPGALAELDSLARAELGFP